MRELIEHYNQIRRQQLQEVRALRSAARGVAVQELARIGASVPVYAVPADLPDPYQGRWATVENYDGDSALVWANGTTWVVISGTATARPAAPTGLGVAALGTTSLRLTWVDNATDETAYRIERSLYGSSWAEIAAIAANAVTYDDTGLEADATYFYRVRCYRAGDGVYSTYSNQASGTTDPVVVTLPAAPTGLSVATLGTTSLRVTWTDNATDESAYRVERRHGGGAWAEVTTLAANAVLYDDTGLESGTTYTYRVRAFRASDGAYSLYSSEGSGATSNPPTLTIQNVAYWWALLLAAFPTDAAKWLSWSGSPNSYYYYFVSDGIYACMMAFLTTIITGNPDRYWLDQALNYTLRMIGQATVMSDGKLGWYSADDGNVEAVLRESRAWQQVAWMLYIMHSNPWLDTLTYTDGRTYAQVKAQILSFTLTHIWSKWWNRSGNSLNNIFRATVHMPSHFVIMAMFLRKVVIDPVYLAQFDKVYLEYSVLGMTGKDNVTPVWSGSSFKDEMKPNPANASAVWWDWNWNENVLPGSDTSHAADPIFAFLMSIELDGFTVWTASDLDAFLAWQLNVNFFGTVASPGYRDWMDGTMDASLPGIYGRNVGRGIAILGRYNQTVQLRLENFPSFFYLPQGYATCARNAALWYAGQGGL